MTGVRRSEELLYERKRHLAEIRKKILNIVLENYVMRCAVFIILWIRVFMALKQAQRKGKKKVL